MASLTNQFGSALTRPAAWWNPLCSTRTVLPPNLLLMAKILALCFILSGQIAALPDHFLPFLPVLDKAGSPADFQRLLQATFLLGSVFLVFNIGVRTCCLVLGGVILLGILSSRPYFENNRTFTGCLLLLAGLYVPGQKPSLIRLQIILLYFGAGCNKLLDADWRSGQFFENMEAHLGHHREFYVKLSSWLPGMWLSRLMSWTVIIVEFVIAGGLSLRRLLGPIVWVGIAYHTALLVLTGYTFGMFYYATLSSFLAFLELPATSPETKLTEIRKTSVTLLSRVAALYTVLIYNPATYLLCAILLSAPLSSGPLFRRVFAALFLLFLSPALLAPVAVFPRSIHPAIDQAERSHA